MGNYCVGRLPLAFSFRPLPFVPSPALPFPPHFFSSLSFLSISSFPSYPFPPLFPFSPSFYPSSHYSVLLERFSIAENTCESNISLCIRYRPATAMAATAKAVIPIMLLPFLAFDNITAVDYLNLNKQTCG